MVDAKEAIEQACLDLSKAALDVFELVDKDGIDAPMEGVEHILRLKAIVDNAEAIRSYYFRRNIQRMLAHGGPASHLVEMPERGRSRA